MVLIEYQSKVFSLAARCAFENVPVRKGDLQTLISKVENPFYWA